MLPSTSPAHWGRRLCIAGSLRNPITVIRAGNLLRSVSEDDRERDEKGRIVHSDNITVERGNSAAYLAARIKRDYPEIAAQLAELFWNGPFNSLCARHTLAGRPITKASSK
jgi:hypothetical protein